MPAARRSTACNVLCRCWYGQCTSTISIYIHRSAHAIGRHPVTLLRSKIFLEDGRKRRIHWTVRFIRYLYCFWCPMRDSLLYPGIWIPNLGETNRIPLATRVRYHWNQRIYRLQLLSPKNQGFQDWILQPTLSPIPGSRNL